MGEIEKQFFETFGIEPKLVITKEDWEKCKNLPRAEELFKQYPQITDRILLELICIANHESVYIDFEGTDVETLKNSLLGNFIYFKRIIPKRQVQALFEDV